MVRIGARSGRPQATAGESRSCCGGSLPLILVCGCVFFVVGRISSDYVADIDIPEGAITVVSTFPTMALDDPLLAPQGDAVALPSIRDAQDDAKRQGLAASIYGGHGDKKHLGGFTEIDIHGISPYVWRMMMQEYGIKSVIDVGCGRGISTLWFAMNGMDALCVEGSHDAYEKTVLPNPATQMVEHDFARGPWWPTKTYDAVWSVEFLEHVGRNFQQNYLPVFRSAAIIFATHSIWGGWHHVEVHNDEWWIRKFELYGFKFMPDLTKQIRDEATREAWYGPLAVNGEKPNPQNLYHMLVFFNPAVGALPEHAHLFAEPGCFSSHVKGNLTTKDCGTGKDGDKETPLPPHFEPLPVVDANHEKWEERIKSLIKPKVR